MNSDVCRRPAALERPVSMFNKKKQNFTQIAGHVVLKDVCFSAVSSSPTPPPPPHPPLNLSHVSTLFLAMPGCLLSVEEMKCVSGLFTLFHIFVTVMIKPHFNLETKVDTGEGWKISLTQSHCAHLQLSPLCPSTPIMQLFWPVEEQMWLSKQPMGKLSLIPMGQQHAGDTVG